jgi:hypothetical protein
MVDESQRQRQTPHTSNALDNYYGWDSSTGRDVRNQPSLPIQYQYRDQGRTVVSDREPRWTDFGANRVNTQLKRPKSFTNMDMFNRPDLGFRYSHMEPGRKSYDLFDIPGDPSQDASIRGTWRRKETAPRTADEYGYLEGAPRQKTTFTEGYISPHHFNEMYGGIYDDAMFRIVDPNTNQIEQYPMAEGIESLQEQANLEDDEILRIRGQYGLDADEAREMYDEMIYGYDRSEKETAGLWQTWQKIKDRLGEDAANDWLASQQQYVNRGGLMSLKG